MEPLASLTPAPSPHIVRRVNDSAHEVNDSASSASGDVAEHDALIDELQALVFLMGRLMTFRYAEGATPDGLSLPQYMLLRTVEHHGSMRVSDIAASLGTKAPAVSMLLQGVEERDLIVREHDSDDRRVILVSLTKKGHSAVKTAEHVRREMTRRLTSSLTLEELRTLVRIQTKLAEAVAAEDE